MSNFIERANLALTKVKLTDKLFFTQNLSLMIKSGVPLTRALESLTAQTDNLKLKLVLKDVGDRIQKGDTLSRALGEHPRVFSEVFAHMIEAGEESGKLEDVLHTLTEQLRKEHDLKSKVKGALAYPTVVLIAMISITTGLIVFVVPKLTAMFTESGMELPLPTRILILVSTFLTRYFYIAGLLGIGIIIAFLKFRKSIFGKKILHKLILYVPILGKLATKVNLARFSRTLSSLLKTDIPVVNAFNIASKVMANIYYKEALNDVGEKLKTGMSVEKALAIHVNLFPATVLQMVSVGEETGTLDSILEEVAKFYEEELDTTLKNLPALLEPVLILALGVTVGAVAIAIMTPIFTFTRGAVNN